MIGLAWRMFNGVDKRLLWKFGYNFGWKGMLSVQKFKKRIKRNEFFPAFLFISVTNDCNLSCQGCWVTATDPPQNIDAATLDNIFTESKKQGCSFFGILGGEPLLYDGLFEVLAKHPDCYFLVFTNGLQIDDKVAKEMRRLGNVSPLISIEGHERVSDERRGGTDVFDRSIQALRHCRENRLVTGVATSICKSNMDDLATEDFISEMAQHGAHYVWYYIYRPVGPNPCPDLCLSSEQIRELRQFIVDVRLTAPVAVVDAYWDHDGNALCPAAVGIGHHISPAGDIEPCPVVQFACDNIGDGTGIYDVFTKSEFLKGFRDVICECTRGCILLDEPERLYEFVKENGVYDSSGRGTAFSELKGMTCMPSHHQDGAAIPEKSFLYRFAKKNWFFGFGAYG